MNKESVIFNRIRAGDDNHSSSLQVPEELERKAQEHFSRHHQVIIDAITQKRSIRIRYGGDDRPRHFDPYVFYQHTGTGNYLIHGLQTLDPNKPDFQPQRRTFNIAEIQSLQLLDRRFEPDEDFDANGMKGANGIIAIIKLK